MSRTSTSMVTCSSLSDLNNYTGWTSTTVRRAHERIGGRLFPKPGDLDMMLKFKLGIFLNTVVGENNPYRLQVFEVVRWADAQDCIDDLVTGALNLNKRNKALRSIAKNLQLDEGEQKEILQAPPTRSVFFRSCWLSP